MLQESYPLLVKLLDSYLLLFAKQHNKQLLFNDTLEVEYIDLDESTQGHLLGVGGGKDLTGPTYLDLKRMGIYFLPRHGKKSCR